eukprot:CAMPEP_0194681100 /NCGR_PEP_ID=MMETSP0295-20121207/11878_1 /TAXON_ID=39354 /ORGANISM="Heterosigma akashiwo, Strain CCMP2393" /LENGTH=72 /DNA_ID=CAMNT_0039567013 /DNA_START=233 /DNA_END=448 /DNA_ORIENTATION=+
MPFFSDDEMMRRCLLFFVARAGVRTGPRAGAGARPGAGAGARAGPGAGGAAAPPPPAAAAAALADPQGRRAA